ncbi:MAG: hypothetical protein AB4426_04080 [Xenococcaceae cyanobacterium]
MRKIDYTVMTDQELKRYLLDHREDREAFYAYMDRRYTRPNREVISPDDPDWETKVIAIIRAQIGDT